MPLRRVETSVLSADNPNVILQDSLLTIELSDRSWNVELGCFTPADGMLPKINIDKLRIEIEGVSLPGSSRKFDVDMELKRAAGVWTLEMKLGGKKAIIPLADWLDPSFNSPLEFDFWQIAWNSFAATFTENLATASSDVRLLLYPDGRFTLMPQDSSRPFKSKIGQNEFRAQQISGHLELPSNRDLPENFEDYVRIAVEFHGIVQPPRIVFDDGTRLTIDSSTGTLKGVFFFQNGQPSGALFLSVPEVLSVPEASLAVTVEHPGSTVKISGFKLAAILILRYWTPQQERILIGAEVPKAPQQVSLERNIVVVVAGPTPFEAEVTQGKFVQFRLDAMLREAYFGGTGADQARLRTFEDDGQRLQITLETIQSGPAVGADAKAVIGPRSNILIPLLAASRIRFVRSRDLLDLTFRFHNVNLAWRDSTISLQESARCVEENGDSEPRMIVEFPPQHIAEQAFFRSKGEAAVDVALDETRLYLDGGSAVPPNDALKKTRDPDFQAQTDEPLADLAESRLAGTSRLAFSLRQRIVKQKPEQVLPLPLKLSSLTHWSGLGLAVSKRALPKQASLARQLQVMEVGPSLTRTEILGRIIREMRPPQPHETSIEIPYRLMLSPGPSAQWKTPREQPAQTGATPIWHARLEDAPAAAQDVRAVWSPDYSPRFLMGTQCEPYPTTQDITERPATHPARDNRAPWVLHPPTPEPPQRSFRTSLNIRDRHELVALSSLYGLPSLRPIPTPPPASHPDVVLSRSPQSVVEPPPDQYPDLNVITDFEEGFYVPQTLGQSDIALSALGGYLEADLHVEPPAAVKGIWPAFTLERWRHLVALGRDISAQVVYKGYLFPIGNRCAWVKRTERRILKHGGNPVAYLIQRMYLVVSAPSKVFPALNQPFQGRQWPVRRFEMITKQTPDILDPTTAAADGGGFEGMIKGLQGTAFWPLVGTAFTPDNVVAFSYRLDGDETSVVSPLLFVDNTAAHSPSDVKTLIDAYNGYQDKLLPLLSARHKGVRRRYAESRKQGDTSYQSDTWILGATAREPRGSSAGILYEMDSAMEGADQPPFYPLLKEASILAQTIALISDGHTSPLRVAYDSNYLAVGFDTAGAPDALGGGNRNPSEIFLRVISGSPRLDLNRNGARGGALVKGNLQVAAFSRTIGLVGGQPHEKTAVTRFSSAEPITADANRLGSDFFSLDAKLLGVVTLREICSGVLTQAAPKLTETLLYSLVDTEQIEDALKAIVESVRKALMSVRNAMNEKLPHDDLHQPIWPQLYPLLSGSMSDLQAALDNLTSQFNAQQTITKESLETLGPALTQVVSTAQALLEEVRRIAQDPIPTVVVAKIDAIKQQLQLIQSAVARIPADVTAEVRKRVKEAVRDELCAHYRSVTDAEQKSQINILFFHLYGRPLEVDGKCAPPDFEKEVPDIAGFRDALLFELIAEPLYRAYEALRHLDDQKQKTLEGIVRALLDWLEGVTQIDEWLILAETFKNDFENHCQQVLRPLAAGLLNSSRLVELERALAEQIGVFETKIEPILTFDLSTLPPELPSEARPQLLQLQKELKSVRLSLGQKIVELGTARRSVIDIANCTTGGDFAQFLSRALSLRRNALEDVRKSMSLLVDAARILPAPVAASSPAPTLSQYITDVANDLGDLTRRLTLLWEIDQDVDSWTGVEQALNVIQGKVNKLSVSRYASQFQQAAKDVQKNVKDLSKALTDAPSPAEKLTAVDAIIGFATARERLLVGLVLELTAVGDKIRGDLEFRAYEIAADIAGVVVGAALPLHERVRDGLGKLSDFFTQLSAENRHLLGLILSKSLIKELEDLWQGDGSVQKRLDADYDALMSFDGMSAKKKVEAARHLFERWNVDGLPVVQAVQLPVQLLESLLSGDVAQLIDFSGLESELQSAVAAFLPTSLGFSYDWQTNLSDFPPGKPIFAMSPSAVGKHLTVIARGAFDVRTQSRSFSVKGTLQPFEIRLFPGIDIVKILFEGAHFESNGAGTSFSANIKGVEIGDKLEYVRSLAQLLNPDTGPYLMLHSSPPAVEAGFRLNIGSFNLGALAFINIHLNLACELPLDNRSAVFRFGLASREKPFLISCPPYGGGGSLTLKAQATELVSIGASFEFGAVVDLSFGPLTGHGRVTSGIAIDKTVDRAEISGFVTAVGEGSIGCFSIGVFFEVRLRQEQNRMVGTAKYRFTFKLGFWEVSFSVGVEYSYSSGSQAKVLNAGLQLDPETIDIGKTVLYWYGTDSNQRKRFKSICTKCLDGDEPELPFDQPELYACVIDDTRWKHHKELFSI